MRAQVVGALMQALNIGSFVYYAFRWNLYWMIYVWKHTIIRLLKNLWRRSVQEHDVSRSVKNAADCETGIGRDTKGFT